MESNKSGKRYRRLAKAFFSNIFHDKIHSVDHMERLIIAHANRDKKATDWEGQAARFTAMLKFAWINRHTAMRRPVYEGK